MEKQGQSKTRLFLGRALGGLVVCLLIFAATFSGSFQKCKGRRATEYNSPYQPKLSEKVMTFVLCESETTDANGELLTALGTIAIAFFTWTLWNTSKEQGVLTRESVNLAREEFLFSNRPHLVVRNVTCRNASPGDEIKISFEIINNGNSPAHIVASAFKVHDVNCSETFAALPFVAVGEPPKNALGGVTLIPSAVLRKSFTTEGRWNEAHFHDHGVHTAGFFFAGKILYRDNMGNQRRLGIMRRLDVSSRRFRPVNDPEFEYDD